MTADATSTATQAPALDPPPHAVVRHAGDWSRFDADMEALTAAALAAAAAALDDASSGAGSPRRGGETAVVFADDALVRALNARYRGKDAATNVLAFPAATEPQAHDDVPLGDVVLAVETIWAEAAAQRVDPRDHLTHLIIHGYLHLQGYDHQTDDKARLMEGVERAALARLGRPDPYAGDRERRDAAPRSGDGGADPHAAAAEASAPVVVAGGDGE